MKLKFTTNERGHRVFKVGERYFRAFWMDLGRVWVVMETGADGGTSFREVGERKNWRQVEVLAAGLEPR